MFDIGMDVCEDLAWVVLVGEAIHHRNPGMVGKAFNYFLIECSHHDHIAHTRYDLGSVFNWFSAAELRISGTQEYRRAAQLVHASFERQSCAGALLLKNHD